MVGTRESCLVEQKEKWLAARMAVLKAHHLADSKDAQLVVRLGHSLAVQSVLYSVALKAHSWAEKSDSYLVDWMVG